MQTFFMSRIITGATATILVPWAQRDPITFNSCITKMTAKAVRIIDSWFYVMYMHFNTPFKQDKLVKEQNKLTSLIIIGTGFLNSTDI